MFSGHEHSYERMYPVYNLEVIQHDYFNARAPIYIVTGTAGCNEKDGQCFSPMRQQPGPYYLFCNAMEPVLGTLNRVHHIRFLAFQFDCSRNLWNVLGVL